MTHTRCDAEVGSVKRGWRGCTRPATHSGKSEYGTLLCYCARHKGRARAHTLSAILRWGKEGLES